MPVCPECGGWSQNGICQYVHDDPIAILKSQLAQSEAKLKIAISALEAIQCHGYGEVCCDGHMAVKREALDRIEKAEK